MQVVERGKEKNGAGRIKWGERWENMVEKREQGLVTNTKKSFTQAIKKLLYS